MKIAVIGGGWAGLAAALTLARAGRRVTLFEAAKQLGGRARSIAWEGLAIDNGQHLMAGAYHQTFALIHELGTTSFLQRRRLDLRAPGFRLALPGLPAPWHLAAGLLKANGLSPGDKWAAVRFMQTLKRQRFRLDTDIPATTLLANHGQPQGLVEQLWEPICVAALNTPLSLASGQVFCNVLRDSLAGTRADSDLVFNCADLGRLLPDAAANYLTDRGSEVRLASRVAGLQSRDGGFDLLGLDETAEQVVLAAHPAQVPKLLAGMAGTAELAGQIRRFSWQPILTTWLHFASPITFPYPMLALGHGTAPWAFDRSDLAPGLVSVVASAEGPHLEEPKVALRDRFLGRLTEAFGPLPRLLNWKTIVEKRATYASTPELIRPTNLTPVPGLYLAGDFTAGDYPATLEGAVRSGVECGRLILERT